MKTKNKKRLSTIDIINSFVDIDAKFAVSSNDLAEVIFRVGSAASKAKQDLIQLLNSIK